VPAGSQRFDHVWIREDSFITAGIVFSVHPELLSARLNILGDNINNELKGNAVSLETEIKNEFQVHLGFLRENRAPLEESSAELISVRHEFVALWDEFALYNAETKQQLTEEQEENPEQVIPAESSVQP